MADGDLGASEGDGEARGAIDASILGDGRVSECVEQDACAKGVAV